MAVDILPKGAGWNAPNKRSAWIRWEAQQRQDTVRSRHDHLERGGALDCASVASGSETSNRYGRTHTVARRDRSYKETAQVTVKNLRFAKKIEIGREERERESKKEKGGLKGPSGESGAETR